MSNTKTDYDVAIVGLGPTGGALACMLGDYGLSVLVLEREADIYDLPRAVHFDDEVMRSFQRIGIAEAMSKQVFVNRGMRFIDEVGNLLVDWPRPQEVSENGWYASYRFHQPDLERLMRSAIKKRPSIDVKLEHLATRLNQTKSNVELFYKPTVGRDEQSIRANFVVGCDGARSMVRDAIGCEMENLGFEQRWLVVDVVLNKNMPELGDYTVQYCDSNRPATYCRNVGLRRRWEFALQDEEDGTEAKEEEFVWNLLSRWVSPNEAKLERSAIYTFRSQVAETWGKDRLFLAGDCAHLTPPFLGQGMCAGIRDATNLAWKLALACQNEGKLALLTSYQSERKSNVIEYINSAVALGELINKMQKDQGTYLGEKSKNGAIKMQSVRAGLGQGLGSLDDPLRGEMVPQILLDNEMRLDDIAAGRSVLISRHDNEGSNIPDAVLLISPVCGSAVPELLDRLETDAIFVRPDMRILASSSGVDAASAVLDIARSTLLVD